MSVFRYSQYQRMLSTLSQCEFSMGKTLLVYDMNLREMENYEKIYKDIGKHEKMLLRNYFCLTVSLMNKLKPVLVNTVYTSDEWFGGFLSLVFSLLDSTHVCAVSIL